MHIVFGRVNSQVDLRCGLCTGRVVALDGTSKLPLKEQDGDPVCRRSRREGGSDHVWLNVVSPVTDYFRTAIQDFWAAEVGDGDVSKVDSATLLGLKRKLGQQLFENRGLLKPAFGIEISLAFDKPPPKEAKEAMAAEW